MKTPELFGYAVMATNTTAYYHDGQYAFFRLKRDAIAWRDREHAGAEIRNAVLKVSVL